MDIFDRIKTLSKEKGLTIEDMLQNADGISLNTYNGWKKRGVIPRGDLCCSIAKELGVSVEYLVRGEQADPPFSPRVMSIARACENASELKLQMMEELLGIIPPGKNSGVSAAE